MKILLVLFFIVFALGSLFMPIFTVKFIWKFEPKKKVGIKKTIRCNYFQIAAGSINGYILSFTIWLFSLGKFENAIYLFFIITVITYIIGKVSYKIFYKKINNKLSNNINKY